jgi:phosphoglycerate dehydrogenase-like enzyme
MVPALTSPDADVPQSNCHQRRKLYILSDFHPESVKYAQSLFDCVLYGDPEGENWRSNATAILIKDYTITAKDLDVAPQLCVIGKQGVGLEKVDVQACEERGVKVCNTPGINASAVAEMTLCLALCVAREVPRLVMRQSMGEIIRKETVSGMLVGGKTVGIIGMGNIGRSVARKFLNGFDTPIVTYDPFFPVDSPLWADIQHNRVNNLEDILELADILTVHVPLTPETKDLISYRELQLMKRSAILLNTARGGIVNEEDLTAALEQDLIWGAGFDCHIQEPPTKTKYARLWNCARFVGTPHIAAATDETQIATINAAIDGVFNFFQKIEP